MSFFSILMVFSSLFSFGSILAHQTSSGMFSEWFRFIWHPWGPWGRVNSGEKGFSGQTATHCAFSSNLFHGHLAQILIEQLSDPENKKCSPWKVFGKNHPQILLLLSRRGPRSPEARLSQHYIGPKMTFQHFSNFCRKNFLDLIKEISCTYWMNVEVLPHDFCKLQPPKLYKNVQEPFCQAGKTFFCRNLKNGRMSFLGQCNVETVSPQGF